MKNKLFFLLIAFSCIQCKNECIDDNIKLGNISFQETTEEYFDIYEDIGIVTFVSEYGESRTHSIQLQESEESILCVKVTCRPTYELEGLNACEYYDADNRYYTLTADDVQLHIKAGMELLEPETEDYYEYINIGVSDTDTVYYAGYITAANTVDPSFIFNSVLDQYLQETEISKHTNTNDILLFENTDFLVVYKLGKGIIKYRTDNVEWTLLE